MLGAGPVEGLREPKMIILVPVPGQDGAWSLVQLSRGKAAPKALAPAVPGQCWLSDKALTASPVPLVGSLWASARRKAQGTTGTLISAFPSLYSAPQFIFHARGDSSQTGMDLFEASAPCRAHPDTLLAAPERSPCPDSPAASDRRWESSHHESLAESLPLFLPPESLLAAVRDSLN